MKPVLLTGASGALGSMLAAHLSEEGWDLMLTDINPFPGPLPSRACFEQADLCDRAAIQALGQGCGAIVHFGGISTERPSEHRRAVQHLRGGATGWRPRDLCLLEPRHRLS
jgi:uronate dehydrogenase